jgi:glucan biosynthesis protein C
MNTQLTTQPQTLAVPLAQSAVSAVRVKTRMAYIDTLRLILTVMVVMVHAAVTYGPIGSWFYHEPATDTISNIVLALYPMAAQAFFMGLFFMISGYFIPASFDRKGQGLFWKDRLLRLGLPLVIFVWVLSKVPMYFADLADGSTTLPFLKYFWLTFWINKDTGPTWFIFILLIFSLGYSLWRLIPGSVEIEKKPLPLPSTAAFLGFAALIALLTMVAGQFWYIGEAYPALGITYLQYIFFPQYILMFIVGILAYRNDWLNRLPGGILKRWSWIALASLIALPLIFGLGGGASGEFDAFKTGWHWQFITTCLWLSISCVADSLVLLLWLRDRHPNPKKVVAFGAANNYGVYIFHPVVLVPLTYWMSRMAIHPMAKFGLAAALTLVICLLITDGLRRIPGLKSIL